MNEVLNLVAALAVGFITGIFFFGGLWWTVQKAVRRSSALIFRASFSIRMMAVGAIVLAFRRDWKALLLLLVGLLLARTIVIARISHRAPRL